MTYETLDVQDLPDAPGVRMVTLSHPPANALNVTMGRDLTELFARLQADTALRCVVLTAAGERFFCAGADVKEVSGRTTQVALDRSALFRGAFEAIRQCPVPTIAAVNGLAVGAGLVIAACCDIVLAAERAEFALPEILIGVMGGTRHAARLMPGKLVRFLALTGERIAARELQQVGQVREVLPRDELLPRAQALAKGIASRSPSAVRLMKEALNLTEDMPVREGYRVEQLFTTVAAGLPDAMEASRAFVERRAPDFSSAAVNPAATAHDARSGPPGSWR